MVHREQQLFSDGLTSRGGGGAASTPLLSSPRI